MIQDITSHQQVRIILAVVKLNYFFFAVNCLPKVGHRVTLSAPSEGTICRIWKVSNPVISLERVTTNRIYATMHQS